MRALKFVLIYSMTSTAPVALAAGSGNSPSGWERLSDEDGIVVYQKDLAGVATISLRGEAVLDANPEDVFAVMKDNAAAHEWMPMVVEKRDLKQISETERIEYTHISMPWPLSDRYFVNSGTVEHLADGTLKVFVKSVDKPEYAEVDKVLGELKYSEFLLKPVDDGQRTSLVLEVNTDIKGHVPKWMVNAAQKSWPRKFLTGLRDQLAKRGKLHPPALAH